MPRAPHVGKIPSRDGSARTVRAHPVADATRVGHPYSLLTHILCSAGLIAALAKGMLCEAPCGEGQNKWCMGKLTDIVKAFHS